MKFCHVVLVMSLGMTADRVLGAQTLPAGAGPGGQRSHAGWNFARLVGRLRP